MRPISSKTMAAALAISWGSMLVHNLYELPLGPLDPENVDPLVVAVGLGVAYAVGQVPLVLASFRAARWAVVERRSSPGPTT